jgi:hypothetical protein
MATFVSVGFYEAAPTPFGTASIFEGTALWSDTFARFPADPTPVSLLRFSAASLHWTISHT